MEICHLQRPVLSPLKEETNLFIWCSDLDWLLKLVNGLLAAGHKIKFECLVLTCYMKKIIFWCLKS